MSRNKYAMPGMPGIYVYSDDSSSEGEIVMGNNKSLKIEKELLEKLNKAVKKEKVIFTDEEVFELFRQSEDNPEQFTKEQLYQIGLIEDDYHMRKAVPELYE